MYYIDIFYYLIPSITIFIFALLGIFLMKKNIILILLTIELMILSINYNFIIFSWYLDDIIGQVFSLYVLAVAAAESSIGLALVVTFYRLKGSITISYLNTIKS